MESKGPRVFFSGSFDKNLDALQIAELQTSILGRLAMAIRGIPDTSNKSVMNGRCFLGVFDTKVPWEFPH